MVVIYKSKTGFTKKYAEIIAKELNCEAVNIKEISKMDLAKQDVIIFGGRIFAGLVSGLKQMIGFLKGDVSKLVIFAVGATPNEATDVIERIWNDNLNEEKLKNIPHFYMQGGMNYEKMGFMDRIIMKMVTNMMKKKKDKDDNENGFIQAVEKSYDSSSEEYTKPLIEYVKKLK